MIFFWTDIILFKYLKSFDEIGSKKSNKIFDWKIIILILVSIDYIIFIAYPARDARPILPFRILRCCI